MRPGTSAEARAPPPFAAAGYATPNAPPAAASVFGVVVRAIATVFGESSVPRLRNVTESEPACAPCEASGMLTPLERRYARMSGIVVCWRAASGSVTTATPVEDPNPGAGR